MNAEEAQDLCDALAELAGKGPTQDPQALVEAKGILRQIVQSAQATTYVKERANDVELALRGWLDAEEKFHALLKGYSSDIYVLIDRLHSALREAGRFKAR